MASFWHNILMRAHNHIVLHTIMLFHLGADQFKDGSTLTSSLWVEHFTQLNYEITKMHLPNIYNMLCPKFSGSNKWAETNNLFYRSVYASVVCQYLKYITILPLRVKINCNVFNTKHHFTVPFRIVCTIRLKAWTGRYSLKERFWIHLKEQGLPKTQSLRVSPPEAKIHRTELSVELAEVSILTQYSFSYFSLLYSACMICRFHLFCVSIYNVIVGTFIMFHGISI